MISICDVENKNGIITVIDQKDFNVPNFHKFDLERLCKYSKANYDCDGVCEKCVITRLMEEKL